ncbi:MAG: hypothetical protein HXX19_11250 [Rhodoferax sp.]|nr:hypothetical protein [Rhodoferax sp.]
MAIERTTEIRMELPGHECAVLDGYVQATGKSRTQVMRDILRMWSDAKLHEATLILRVAGRNPGGPEAGRNDV